MQRFFILIVFLAGSCQLFAGDKENRNYWPNTCAQRMIAFAQAVETANLSPSRTVPVNETFVGQYESKFLGDNPGLLYLTLSEQKNGNLKISIRGGGNGLIHTLGGKGEEGEGKVTMDNLHERADDILGDPAMAEYKFGQSGAAPYKYSLELDVQANKQSVQVLPNDVISIHDIDATFKHINHTENNSWAGWHIHGIMLDKKRGRLSLMLQRPEDSSWFEVFFVLGKTK